jgi:hypothetical protein
VSDNQHALALGRAVLQTIEHITQRGEQPTNHFHPELQAAEPPTRTDTRGLFYSAGRPELNGRGNGSVGYHSVALGDLLNGNGNGNGNGHGTGAPNFEATSAADMYALRQDGGGGTGIAGGGANGMESVGLHNPRLIATSSTPQMSTQLETTPGGSVAGPQPQYLQSYSAFFPTSEALHHQLQKGRRACSYCHIKGHNVRTCDQKRQDASLKRKRADDGPNLHAVDSMVGAPQVGVS